MNDNGIRERLTAYLRERHVSKRELAARIGISEKTLGNKLNGTRRMDLETLKLIVASFEGLSLQWVMTGQDPVSEESSSASPAIFARHARIPLVSQYAQAGYLSGYMDPYYMETLPTIDFTPDREMTGNYLAFEVRGDSMDDGSKESYTEGEIVICREVEPYLWRDSRLHINKRDFVIVHEDGVLLKRIVNHDVQHHTITIHSLNPNPVYADKVIDLANVRKIFSVVESRKQRKRL